MFAVQYFLSNAVAECESGAGCEIRRQSGRQLLQRSSVLWRILEFRHVKILRGQLWLRHEVMTPLQIVPLSTLSSNIPASSSAADL